MVLVFKNVFNCQTGWSVAWRGVFLFAESLKLYLYLGLAARWPAAEQGAGALGPSERENPAQGMDVLRLRSQNWK